jgi:hypothetical protein
MLLTRRVSLRRQDASALHRTSQPKKLGISGIDKVVTFDRSASLDDCPANGAGTNTQNEVVTFPKKPLRSQG